MVLRSCDRAAQAVVFDNLILLSSHATPRACGRFSLTRADESPDSHMAETHTIELAVPVSVAVTLRGINRELNTESLPEETWVWLIEKGIQRGANDPLGAIFKKGEEVDESKVDEYWTDLVTRWNNGEVTKTRSGGLGRTSDPVLREMKRLANEEINANIGKLLAAHSVTRKEFDESYRAKYLKKRLDDHGERLRAVAVENLSKLQDAAEEEEIEILDF